MLNVFLGYACNFRCGYCLQEPETSRAPMRNPDSSKFITDVIPWAIQKPIKRIAYWGGEPLLKPYFKEIQKIHTEFQNRGHTFDFVKFATNGSLLDEEKVAWLNSINAYVIVSQHIGYGEPNWDMVAKLKSSSLSFLFTHDALDPFPWMDKLDELEAKYKRPFFPYIHYVRATDGADPKYWITHEDLKVHEQHLWALAKMRIEGHRHAFNMLEGLMQDWRNQLKPGEDAKPLCYGDHQIDIDLKGNRYICHHTVNTSTKCGTITETPKTDTEHQAFDTAHKWVSTAECKSCPIKTWCRGNCHLSHTHSVDCTLSKLKHRVFSWVDAYERDTPITVKVD